jgi:hypothetical protein
MLPKYHVTSTSCQLVAVVVGRGARHSGDHAVRPLIAVTLAALELAAVVLFVIPRTLILGAILLIVVLALAAAVHLSLKQTPSLAYLVYAAAIWVVVQDTRRTGPIGGGR